MVWDKERAREYGAEYRRKNKEKLREQDRIRNTSEKRRAGQAKKRQKIRECPERLAKYRESQIRWLKKNKEKRQCHVKTCNAIRDGRLKREDCATCGRSKDKAQIHAHHEDYKKPLDVVWLCVACHGKRHQEINKERRDNGR